MSVDTLFSFNFSVTEVSSEMSFGQWLIKQTELQNGCRLSFIIVSIHNYSQSEMLSKS